MSENELAVGGNRMRKLKRGAMLLAIYCLLLPSALESLAHGTDKKEIVRQARQSYYNLANAGMNEFRCQVLPDWDTTFKTLKADPIGRDQVLPILRKTHFELLVGPDGASTVSHRSELVPPNEDVAERVRKATGGTEQVLTGFLHTWSGFMVKPTPLPDAARSPSENCRLKGASATENRIVRTASQRSPHEARRNARRGASRRQPSPL